MTRHLCKSTHTTAGSDVLAAGRNTSIIPTQKDRPSLIDKEMTLIGPDTAVEFSLKLGLGLFVLLLCMAWATPLHADVIVIGGAINQSTEDGAGPAENNPSLNNIKDGELYIFSLDFTGSITAPGTYDRSGNLVVPDGVDGIDIAHSGVALDLNGFSIRANQLTEKGAGHVVLIMAADGVRVDTGGDFEQSLCGRWRSSDRPETHPGRRHHAR